MLRTGDILNCQGHRWLSKLIGKFTHSKFTHTAIVVIIEDQTYIVEMQKNGCETKTYENWVIDYGYDYVVTRSDNPPSRIKILSKSGTTNYDFALLALRFPFRLLQSAITGKRFKVEREKKEDNRMTCSEFVAWCYGWDDPQNYSPKDVYEKSKKEGFKEL